jgi:hypothetical protein
VADGYQVDPDALDAAGRQFHDGSDSVADAAALLSVAQLVPNALGEVDAAHELSSAFAEFVGRHGDDLRHGAVWVDDAADGLTGSAASYRRTDDESAAELTGLAG